MARRGGLTAMAVLLAASLGLAGCSTHAGADPEDDVLRVYATTGYLADAVVNIAPEADVTTMVGPGGDPHTYQPSTRDIQRIQSADVVFWNGLYLEAHMVDPLESLGERQLAVGERIPEDLLLDWPETDDKGNPLHDPHIWNNPEAWTLAVQEVADKLAAIDPGNAQIYRANVEDYLARIAAAHSRVEVLMASVPPERRILITGHDAFSYFGATHDFDVYATDFISTNAQLSPEELSSLADLITEHEVPVIFQDNQANPQAITSLKEAVRSRGWDVAVSDAELYADSLGAQAGVDTYIGVYEHNALAVVDALGTTDGDT